MRWRVRKPEARFRAKKVWHIWFAWTPVRVPTEGRLSGMTMVWLEQVLRKGKYSDCGWEWEYKHESN